MREAPPVGRRLYTFRSVWRVRAGPDEVYGALERLLDYPVWWPQVQRATALDEEACEFVCRSALPFSLRFTVRQAVRDPAGGILEGSMVGDLEGFSRWTVVGASQQTTAVFDEQVVTNKPLIHWIGAVGRPALVGNHRWMMRQGERGLRSYLADGRVDSG